jgi:hypothetical protein
MGNLVYVGIRGNFQDLTSICYQNLMPILVHERRESKRQQRMQVWTLSAQAGGSVNRCVNGISGNLFFRPFQRTPLRHTAPRMFTVLLR